MKVSKLFVMKLSVLLVLTAASTVFAQQSLKKLVAVEEFENKAGAASNWKIGTGMADMLTDALIHSGNFIVLERQAVQSVLAEQDFAASGTDYPGRFSR